MPIREARLSDHYAMAVVFGKAFFNEDLFGRIIHPHRDTYPDDVTLYWLRRIREHWFDWRNCFLVVVTKDCDGKEAIVGVAEWTRQGAGSKAMELNMFDPRALPFYRVPFTVNLHFHVCFYSRYSSHDLSRAVQEILEDHYSWRPTESRLTFGPIVRPTRPRLTSSSGLFPTQNTTGLVLEPTTGILMRSLCIRITRARVMGGAW